MPLSLNAPTPPCHIQVAPDGADTSCRLLTTLLQALASQLPRHLSNILQRASQQPTTSAATTTARENFCASQALSAQTAAQASCLSALYTLGRRIATATLMRRSAPPQAAAALERVAALLAAGGREGAGDALAAALCAVTGGGIVDGILASASMLVADAPRAAARQQLSGAPAAAGAGGSNTAAAAAAAAAGAAATPLGLPATHPLAASCMQLLAALAHVCSRCAEAVESSSGAAGGLPMALGTGGVDALAAAAVAAAAGGVKVQGVSLADAAAEDVHSAVLSVSSACAGHAYATLLRTHGAVLPAQPTPGGLLCVLSTVLDAGLSPAELYCQGLGVSVGGTAAAQTSADPSPSSSVAAAATTLLQQEVGPLARWVADWSARALPLARLRIAGRLHAASRRAASCYACYAAAAPPEALQGRQAAAVKNVLDRTFAVHIAVLCSLWPPPPPSSTSSSHHNQQQQQQQQSTQQFNQYYSQPPQLQQQVACAADNQTRAMLAVQLVAALVRLQFCRLQLPQYTGLVQSLVGEVSGSEAAAEQLLAFSTCFYRELVTHQPTCSQAGSGTSSSTSASNAASAEAAASRVAAEQPTPLQWQHDGVSAASLVFLLPLLPVALRTSHDPSGTPAAAALPLVLLAVAHPIPQAALAAHSAFASIAAACGERGCDALVERAAPTYVRRSVEAFPAAGSFEGMQLGFHFLWKHLPPGSGAALLAVRRLCERAATLVADATAAAGATTAAAAASRGGDGSGGGGDDEPSDPRQGRERTDRLVVQGPEAEAATQLFALLFQGALSLDYQQLPAALTQLDALLRSAPRAMRREWVADAQAAVLASQNVVTKHRLVAWVQAVAAGAVPVAVRSKL